jgi:tRNA 2-thiouridine synthesizing protein E
MTTLIETLMEMEKESRDPQFPHAPAGWSASNARTAAKAEGLALTDEHWDVIRAVQEYFAKHAERKRNMRELHDALDERFHASGGIKHLYQLFPKGPIAQGCRIAGLNAPGISEDPGFGSVM